MSDQRVIIGNSLRVLKELEPESIDVCVTSPPYWGHRGMDEEGGQPMITAKELERITSTYGVDGPETIPIEGEDYMERIARGTYILHRPDGDFQVKGIGWGHGHLFIFTAERGTTGISYLHEPIAPKYTEDDQEDDGPVCPGIRPKNATLDAWMGSE